MAELKYKVRGLNNGNEQSRTRQQVYSDLSGAKYLAVGNTIYEVISNNLDNFEVKEVSRNVIPPGVVLS